MRKIIVILALVPYLLTAQNNIKKTAAVPYTQGPPTFTPGFSASSEIAIDTSTGKIYQFHRTTMAWLQLGQGIDVISGTIPPAYTPARNQSNFAINGADSLYGYRSGAWHHLNGGSGAGDDWGAQVVETDATLTGDGTIGDPLSWAGAFVTGALTGSGTSLVPLDVINNGITDAKLRQSAGLSVIGRASNSTGNVADITAGSDAYVLRRSGTALDFGQVVAGGIATGAVTPTKTSGFTNNSMTHADGSGVLTGDGTLTFETNTIHMYPTANDTLLAFIKNSRMFGINTFVDPFNGGVNAFKIGGLSGNTRIFMEGFGFYMDAPFYQSETEGIGFYGTSGNMRLNTNGDYYTATLAGDNQTATRNLTYYFTSGGSATGKGNPVIFQQVHSTNDTLCNSFEFLARNTASGGITHPDSTLFRVGNWDRGTALNITQSRNVGIKTRTPGQALDVNGNIRNRGLVIEDHNDITGTTTVTASSTITDNLYKPGSTQTTLTFNLPASPTDGQLCRVCFNNIVTTLTVSGNGNTLTGTAITTAAVGDCFAFKYYNSITAWIRTK